jgi:hypothetical protein
MGIKEEKILLNLIEQGDVLDAIEHLSKCPLQESQRKEVISIASRYHRLKRKDRLGILSFEQVNISENQIVNHLIDLINWPEEQPYPESKSIEHRPAPRPILWKYISLAAILFVILAVLIDILNYINLSPNSDNSLQLTVFVTDIKGNAVLENQGRLHIPIGNRALNELIGVNGRTNFPDINAKYKGDTIIIGLQADGWEIADGKNTFIFDGRPIGLKVKNDGGMGIISGIVKSRDGQEMIGGAKLLVNADTSTLSNLNGVFKLILPESMWVKNASDHYELTVIKEGYETMTFYYFPRTYAEIRLTKK